MKNESFKQVNNPSKSTNNNQKSKVNICCVSLGVGDVQIVGLDYRKDDRQRHVAGVLSQFPPREDVKARLLMLHDPGKPKPF